MDLFTSSGSSITAAAAEKAVETWAVRRPFGGVDNGQFAASMGTVVCGGQTRRSHHHCYTRMCVVGEGATRVLVRSERGGRKSVHNVGVDRDGGLTLLF